MIHSDTAQGEALDQTVSDCYVATKGRDSLAKVEIAGAGCGWRTRAQDRTEEDESVEVDSHVIRKNKETVRTCRDDQIAGEPVTARIPDLDRKTGIVIGGRDPCQSARLVNQDHAARGT